MHSDALECACMMGVHLDHALGCIRVCLHNGSALRSRECSGMHDSAPDDSTPILLMILLTFY